MEKSKKIIRKKSKSIKITKDIKTKQKNNINSFLTYTNEKTIKSTEPEYLNDFLTEDDLYKFKTYGESPRVLSENEYLEKMIISKFIDEFNVDHFFYKNKEKLFNKVVKHKFSGGRHNNSIKRKLKGGNYGLTNRGNDLLKVLHLCDAKHDFSKISANIADYIDEKFDRLINIAGLIESGNAHKDFLQQELFENKNNYEENILRYVMSSTKDVLSDVSDDNANIMYIDVNLTTQQYEYRDNLNMAVINTTQDKEYDSLAELIKNFYNFTDGNNNNIGYLFDTQVKTHATLDQFIKHLTTDILNKFSVQLYPFENAYDPHSSTKIEFPSPDDDEKFEAITNANFNTPLLNNEHFSAFRDLTRENLNICHIKLPICAAKVYLNVKCMKLTLALINSSFLKTHILYNYFNFNSIIAAFVGPATDPNKTLKSSVHNDLIFHMKDNIVNVAYYKSFNNVPLLKECIEKLLAANITANINSFIDSIYTPAFDIELNNDSSKWLLYFIVIYLIIANYNPAIAIRTLRDNIIDILLDLKKSGDWGQALFCSKYNMDQDNKDAGKECYFVSGDKLSATRAILTGNVKTITAVDYNLLTKKDTTKKCLLTLFNGIRKLTFIDLKDLVEKSLFESSEAFKFSNFKHNDIINRFKTIAVTPNDTIITDDNINYQYFWFLIVIVIYQTRIYNNCYSVFKITPNHTNPLNCEMLKFDNQERFKIKAAPRTALKLTPNYNFVFNNKTEYQIDQFNENIFINGLEIDNSDLNDYFKLIEDDIVENDYLDEKYLNDILTLFKNVFNIKTDINKYNKATHNNLYNYLKYVLFIPNRAVISNSNAIIKFFKKICNLNKLCQILYIDNYTKQFDNITDLMDAIHTRNTILNYNHQIQEKKEDLGKIDKEDIAEQTVIKDKIAALNAIIKAQLDGIRPKYKDVNYIDHPKTILKDIIDTFYDKVCILIHTIQGSCINIGEETYMPVLKALYKSTILLEKNIRNFKEIKQKINQIQTAVDNLYANKTDAERTVIKNDLILQITRFDDIKEGINLLNQNKYSNYDSDKEMFDKYLAIYDSTAQYFQEVNIETMATNTVTCNDVKMLKSDLIKSREPDMQHFINYMITKFDQNYNATSECITEISKYIAIAKDAFYKAGIGPAVVPGAVAVASITSPTAASAKKKQPLIPSDYDKLIEAEISINKLGEIIEIYTNPANNPSALTTDEHITNANTIIFHLVNINAFEGMFRDKIRRVKTRAGNIISEAEENIINLFNRSISNDLFDYFNTIVLYYYPLIQSTTTTPQLMLPKQTSLKNCIEELLTTPKLEDNYFTYVYGKRRSNNKEVKLSTFNEEIVKMIEQMEKNLNIVNANIFNIYRYKTTVKFELEIPDKFLNKRTLFYEDVYKFKDPEEEVVRSTRSVKGRPDPNARKYHYIWYADEGTLNTIYNTMYNSKKSGSAQPPKSTNFTENAIIRDFYKNKMKTVDLNVYFEDLAFIMNLQTVLKDFIDNTYTKLYDISTFIDINKDLTINTLLHDNVTTINKDGTIKSDLTKNDFNHYYNDQKYKLIAVIRKYIKTMIAQKITNLLDESRTVYGFNDIFKYDLLPNPEKKRDTICKIFDIITDFTKTGKTQDKVKKLTMEDFDSTYMKYEKIKDDLISLTNHPDMQDIFGKLTDKYANQETVQAIQQFVEDSQTKTDARNAKKSAKRNLEPIGSPAVDVVSPVVDVVSPPPVDVISPVVDVVSPAVDVISPARTMRRSNSTQGRLIRQDTVPQLQQQPVVPPPLVRQPTVLQIPPPEVPPPLVSQPTVLQIRQPQQPPIAASSSSLFERFTPNVLYRLFNKKRDRE
jgi:hypothetical protein